MLLHFSTINPGFAGDCARLKMRPAVQSERGARQVLSAPADSPATERPDGSSAMPGLLHRVKGKTAEIRACSARFRAENAEQRFAEREIHKICHGIAVLTAPFFDPFDQHPNDGVCVKAAERLPVGRGRRPAGLHLAAGEEGIHALQKRCAEKPLQFIPPEGIVCTVQDRVIFFHKGHDKQEILSDDEKDKMFTHNARRLFPRLEPKEETAQGLTVCYRDRPLTAKE